MKTFSVQQNIGKARHVVSFHDGVKVHKDNSPFFDVRTFGRKREMEKFVNGLKTAGYVPAFKKNRMAEEQNSARKDELYQLLDDAHTELNDEDSDAAWLPSFREWLGKAAADPYHSHHQEAKEYLALEMEN